MQNISKLNFCFLFLILFLGCKYKTEIVKKENTCYYDDFFYLVQDRNGIPNMDGKILVHKLDEDSLITEPTKICSLHLYPDWERKDFPKEVFNFPNLKYLWVAMRDFNKLPERLSELEQLKHLDLQNSNLVKLSENIGDLKNLEELTLLHSEVEELPVSICKLENLRKLHIGGTKIKQLPQCLKELKNLEVLIFFYEDEKEHFSEDLQNQIEVLKKELPNCFFALG